MRKFWVDILVLLKMIQWLVLLIFTIYISVVKIDRVEGYLLVIALALLNNFDFNIKGE